MQHYDPMEFLATAPPSPTGHMTVAEYYQLFEPDTPQLMDDPVQAMLEDERIAAEIAASQSISAVFKAAPPAFEERGHPLLASYPVMVWFIAIPE